MPFDTPILLITFNRPDTTARVFDAIKVLEPKNLFISGDGPRLNINKDIQGVNDTRKIFDKINWDCDLRTLFRDKNLGCKLAVSSAIDWFFENVEEGIILEDDCLPSQSFFLFCDQLLDKYRDEKRIMTISGVNFQFGSKRGDASYYFSKYNHIWGWATWRRAWRHYDAGMKTWPETLKSNRPLCGIAKKEWKYWKDRFDKTYSGKINTWDYQWTYACWLNNGVSALPQKNLVSNIGFGANGSHTFNKNDRYSNLLLQDIEFPLKHPGNICIDEEADSYTFETHFKPRNLFKKIINRMRT